MHIVCFGPGPMFKGGIQNYNTSLAKALNNIDGVKVTIVSWTQMYPAIFPRDLKDRSSKKDILEGTDIEIIYLTNYNNPLTWSKTVSLIKSMNADKVIFQWSLAIQGLPMGWIAKRLSKKTKAEIIFDCHFVIQKEGSRIDNILTNYGLGTVDTFVTHASQTTEELKILFPKVNFKVTKTGERKHSQPIIIELYHPVYDLFSPDAEFDINEFKKSNKLKEHVFLFFGFIRKYKGLHDVIDAFKILSDKREDVSLIICGESFWETLDKNKLSTKIKNLLFGIAQKILLKKKEKESDYRPLLKVQELGLSKKVLLRNDYVANEEVHKYFQASDSILLFYEYATPSGVESISYNFKKPILATKVGHFPETVSHGVDGYLAQPGDVSDMAAIMELSIKDPIVASNIDQKVAHMSWSNYAKAIAQK